MIVYAPAESYQRPELGLAASPVPPMSTLPAARSWLDAERPALVAAAMHAAQHGWPTHVSALASVLYRYFDNGSHFAEAMTVYENARRSARETGDLTAEGRALYFLGIVEIRRSRLAQAEAYTRQALARQRQAGDRTSEASSLLSLGIIELERDRYEQATEYLQQSLAASRETANQHREAYALANLAIVHQRQGRYEEASAHLVLGLQLARQIGSYSLETRALAECCWLWASRSRRTNITPPRSA
jgi:tetratricopeptide (TPR) repeat protein